MPLTLCKFNGDAPDTVGDASARLLIAFAAARLEKRDRSIFREFLQTIIECISIFL
jgi:hypothetical protein